MIAYVYRFPPSEIDNMVLADIRWWAEQAQHRLREQAEAFGGE